MFRHMLMGVLALMIITLSFDLAGVRSVWVVVAGVLVGVAIMLFSAWREDKRAGRR
jgi:hypothetical protein